MLKDLSTCIVLLKRNLISIQRHLFLTQALTIQSIRKDHPMSEEPKIPQPKAGNIVNQLHNLEESYGLVEIPAGLEQRGCAASFRSF